MEEENKPMDDFVEGTKSAELDNKNVIEISLYNNGNHMNKSIEMVESIWCQAMSNLNISNERNKNNGIEISLFNTNDQLDKSMVKAECSKRCCTNVVESCGYVKSKVEDKNNSIEISQSSKENDSNKSTEGPTDSVCYKCGCSSHSVCPHKCCDATQDIDKNCFLKTLRYRGRTQNLGSNPYINFLMDFRNRNKKLHPTATISKGAAEWRKLNDNTKLAYIKEAFMAKMEKSALRNGNIIEDACKTCRRRGNVRRRRRRAAIRRRAPRKVRRRRVRRRAAVRRRRRRATGRRRRP